MCRLNFQRREKREEEESKRIQSNVGGIISCVSKVRDSN